MMCRLRDAAAVGAGVLSVAVLLAVPGHAVEGCGVGMYYNNANAQCEPWAPVGVDFAPAVTIPVLDPVPLGIGFDPSSKKCDTFNQRKRDLCVFWTKWLR